MRNGTLSRQWTLLEQSPSVPVAVSIFHHVIHQIFVIRCQLIEHFSFIRFKYRTFTHASNQKILMMVTRSLSVLVETILQVKIKIYRSVVLIPVTVKESVKKPQLHSTQLLAYQLVSKPTLRTVTITLRANYQISQTLQPM
jgi:hypothetical protein